MQCRLLFNPHLDSAYRSSYLNLKMALEPGEFWGFKTDNLKNLPELARFLGIRSLHIKDESRRCGLNSFKVLGARWAIKKRIEQKAGKIGKFAAATDGNHGLGVAFAAKEQGSSAIIWMPEGAAPQRVEAIRNMGAQCFVSDCNYDRTVAELAALAQQKGWELIQDTAWDGYEEIPRWIMQGYAVLAAEIAAVWPDSAALPTHFILQAGVGSFAAALAAPLIEAYPHAIFVLAEPSNANCYYRSFEAGRPQLVDGALSTIMAGLACGRPNPLAWEVLSHLCSAAISCPDWTSACAMRILWGNLPGDRRIESGESGAASLGALLWLALAPEAAAARSSLGIGKDARVVLVNTEGATNVDNFRKIVWGGAYPAPADFPL